MSENPLDTPGYPPEAFEEAFNETMRVTPAVDMMGLRDRALTVAVTLDNDSIEDLLFHADKIQAYILNGDNPYAATEATD
jgi:hypothetical protein